MKDRVAKYLLILPAAAVILGTTIWPLASALLASFRDWRLKRSALPGRFVGWDNYAFAFEEPDFLNALAVTARFVVLDVTLTVALALGLALLLRRAGIMQSLTRAVLIIPFAMSPALIGVSFRFMFNGEHGVIAHALGAIPGLGDVIWLAHPTFAMLVLVASDVWHWFPYMTLVVLGGLAAIPVETEEAARIGAGAAACRAAPAFRGAGRGRRAQDHLRAEDVRPGGDADGRRARHIDPDPGALHLHRRLRALRHGSGLGARLDADAAAGRRRRLLSAPDPAGAAGGSWLNADPRASPAPASPGSPAPARSSPCSWSSSSRSRGWC
jgi:ABC-type spermidine/putrescine transport system permease subunit II